MINKTILENVNTGEIIEFEEVEIIDNEDEVTFEEFMAEIAALIKE